MTTTLLTDAPPALEPAWEVARLFPAQGAWGEADYLELKTNQLVEYSHGTVEVLTMPTDKHQSIVAHLYRLLFAFATQIGGKVLFAPLRLRLWPGKIREPDLVFLASARDVRRQDELWTGADLVIEVVSADDPQRDLVTKRIEYAQAGISEYWIVDPRTDSITVLQLAGSAYVEHGCFTRGATVTSVILPGLTVEVGGVMDAA